MGKIQRERAPALSCQAIHDPLFSEPRQFRILKIKLYGFSSQELVELDMRYNRVHTLPAIFLPGPDEHTVYEGVCEGRPQFLQGFGRKYPPDKKELGTIDRFTVRKFHREIVLNGLFCRIPYIISHARQEPDFDSVIEKGLCRFVHPELLNNGVDELGADPSKLITGKIPRTSLYRIYIHEM